MTVRKPTDASIILTYRCPMRCQMCNIWKTPTDKSEEIKAEDLRSLPHLKFINLTGGEPFVREDLAEIVEECYRHTGRIVISTSGYFEERVIELAYAFLSKDSAVRTTNYADAKEVSTAACALYSLSNRWD